MKTVLFDLDGTLINHFSAIHRSINYAQEQLNLPLTDYDTVRVTVGGSILLTLERLIGAENIDAALPHFRKYFEEIMLDDVLILPGAEWLLKNLHEKDYKLAVFTNKIGDHARAVINHLGFDTWLQATIGTEDTPYRKPNPLFTMHILEVMDTASDETILIGDSPFDYAAAEAGCLAAAYLVTTGSHDATQLAEETAADGIYPSLYQLGADVFGLNLPERAE